MTITYKTNHATTSKSTTEWFFGKKFVKSSTDTLMKLNKADGRKQLKVWQDGTGYLTIEIH